MPIRLPKFRPFNEFAQLKSFSMPEPPKYLDRVQVNLIYYQANYLGIVAICLLFVCIYRPMFFFTMLLVVGGILYLFAGGRGDVPIVIGGRALTKQEVTYSFGGVSALLCLLTGGFTFIKGIGFACAFILAHVSFRERSLKSRGTAYVDVDLMGGNTPLGAVLKDDDSEMSESEDVENPKAKELRDKQAKFRSQFRANMRAKYGVKPGAASTTSDLTS